MKYILKNWDPQPTRPLTPQDCEYLLDLEHLGSQDL